MMGGSDFKKPDCILLHQAGPRVFHEIQTQEEKPSLAVRTNLDEEMKIQLWFLSLLEVFSMILGKSRSFSVPRVPQQSNKLSLLFSSALPPSLELRLSQDVCRAAF